MRFLLLGALEISVGLLVLRIATQDTNGIVAGAILLAVFLVLVRIGMARRKI